MTLEEAWQRGVETVTDAFLALDRARHRQLEEKTAGLVDCKSSMQALLERVDAAGICRRCAGECCAAGKYHFTAADLLVYLVNDEPLFAPLFDNGLCPFLGSGGCLMPAGYRPFNCITFNCEAVEDLLLEEELARFYELERVLRRLYGEIGSLLPGRTFSSALLSLSEPR